jgi:hypothetical protein
VNYIRKAKLSRQAQGLKIGGVVDEWVDKTAPGNGMEE